MHLEVQLNTLSQGQWARCMGVRFVYFFKGFKRSRADTVPGVFKPLRYFRSPLWLSS